MVDPDLDSAQEDVAERRNTTIIVVNAAIAKFAHAVNIKRNLNLFFLLGRA